MAPVTTAEVPVVGSDGATVGAIKVWLLPGAEPLALLDATNDEGADPGLEAIQLLEDYDYRYAIQLHQAAATIDTDRPEVVRPDDAAGLTGRLRTASYVGLLP